MSAIISSTNPSCFLLLIDQSASMQNSFGGREQGIEKKADSVAGAVNRLLQNLVIKCAKSEGVRDYYSVGVIGYGAEVKPALGGTLAGQYLVPISQIAQHPLRIEQRIKQVEDGTGQSIEQTIRSPVWLDAVAQGKTPMCQAMQLAHQLLSAWLKQHPDCFPPIVINMTDGAATDGDPMIIGRQIKNLTSNDGHALLFNIHFSSYPVEPIEFPDNDIQLPGKYAKQLFQLSSLLPEPMRKIARQEYGISVSEKTRGFTFHADMVALVKFLDIGTRPGHLD